MSEPILGLLEVHDRNAALVARLAVTRWPVTVGRSLDCDLVIDDPHTAAAHVRIDRPVDGAPAQAHVLDTLNGISIGAAHYPAGTTQAWLPQRTIQLGRSRLSLRLADAALPAELPLDRSSWRNAGWTVLLVGLLLGWMLGLMWLAAHETDKFAQGLPMALMGMLALIGAWGGLSALAGKLFSGHPQFWRHVRIACGAVLAEALASGALHLLAFMFSWETLARLDYLITAPILVYGLYLQLALIAPQHKRGLRTTVVALFVAGVAIHFGDNWLETKRLVSQRQLSSLFPPSWRVAPAVPVEQFLDEAKTIRERLDERQKEEPSSGDEAWAEDD